MAIQLEPGQTIWLTGAGRKPTRVRMGLGWRSRATVDLDASALLYAADRTLVDQVWFRQLTSKDGSIQHTGDNTTGRGEGDLESIKVDLSTVPEAVATLVFTINSCSRQRFSTIDSAHCRLVDETNGDEELGSFDLRATGSHTAQIMAKLDRDGDGWTMTAIGSPAEGTTYADLLTVIAGHLSGEPVAPVSPAGPVEDRPGGLFARWRRGRR